MTSERTPGGGPSRRWAGPAAALLALAVVVLTFADRAPGYTIDRAGHLRQYGSSLERLTGIDVIDRSDVPFSVDVLAHLGLWFMVGVAAHLLLAGRRWPEPLGRGPIRQRSVVAVVTVLAVLFEYGQSVLTSTRNLELVDGLANLVGALAGLAVASVVSQLASALRPVLAVRGRGADRSAA